MAVLLLALGAAAGAPARYLTDRLVRTRHDSRFPWGTLIVNVTGSALLGFLAALPGHAAPPVLTGSAFCGAFTTYSTFGYETVRLVERRAYRLAAINVTASVVVSLAAAFAGYAIARAVAP